MYHFATRCRLRSRAIVLYILLKYQPQHQRASLLLADLFLYVAFSQRISAGHTFLAALFITLQSMGELMRLLPMQHFSRVARFQSRAIAS